MSIHLPPGQAIPDPEECSTSGSESGDDDQTFDDWVDDDASVPCRSLFDDTVSASAEESLKYDEKTHGFDLQAIATRLSLDSYGRIRLINYIRETKPSPKDVLSLTGKEPLFTADQYLKPVLEDDPLLLLQTADEWSDDEESADPSRKIRALENKLAQAQRELAEYRSIVNRQLDLDTVRTEEPSKPARDDDTHYFDSYAENDIHAVMIQDKVRTSTYAHFILGNANLFRDAIVLDVGCGTGILSLFAARSGAKRVFAVDASDIALRAEKIVKENGYEDIVTVIRGKVEDIQLPDGIEKVDVIISEWMGYALLYESMLDSVLRARDRFNPSVMAPSQCQMMLALCDGDEVYKDRVEFWNDIYGLDMSAMAENFFDDAVVDVVGPQSLLSDPAVIKDLYLGDIKPGQLDFTSTFQLVSTNDRRSKVRCLCLYFDTFFTASGAPIKEGTAVSIIKNEDPQLAEVWPVGGKPAPKRRASSNAEKEKDTSFSTGPRSIPTHWKQTLLFLREPITVSEGTVVYGSFHCKKSTTNSRELDVEVHYSTKPSVDAPATEDTVVQMYKIR
ncbi:S-adenosyl-L-methionine-dependent methyltransferase [Schizophyllum amplum]|uniref:type I protein arginine methyltransferase n=1 Tax=Schizophyllum amplum TaxID=97359 RepID=A0A550CBA9_9AGAR|nr:S-adenosyl-L-methionine-dependent methyltransferase [Auriculariopsis ampla]